MNRTDSHDKAEAGIEATTDPDGHTTGRLRSHLVAVWPPHTVPAVGPLSVWVVASQWGRSRVEYLSIAVPVIAGFTTPEVFREIAIAFTIIGLVAASLERARIKVFSDELTTEVRERLDEIEKTASARVMRGPLPREYYEHIFKLMLLNRVRLTEWNVRLVFSWHDAGCRP